MELDLELLKEQVRAEVSARRLAFVESASPPLDLPELPFEAISVPRISVSTEPISLRDEYTVGELLAFHDDEFIRNAYWAFLRREPDPVGFAHHLSVLYRGDLSKIEILGVFKESEEGRKAGVRVRGLERGLRLRRWRRIPALGRLICIAQYLINLPIVLSGLEHREILLFRRERELRDAINAVEAGAERTQNSLFARSATAVSAISDLLRRIDQEKASRATSTALTGRLTSLRFEVSKVADDLHLGIARLAESKADAQEVASRFDEMFSRAKLEAVLGEDDHGLDDFYVAFEDHFRGTSEDIKDRVAIYLPIVKEAQAGTEAFPILDVGCGRGEWLEVLKESGLVGRGLDLNSVMVQHCRDLGLDVSEADAVDYLRDIQADSLGAITGIHVIEHLPFRRRILLLDAALRALKPGGVAIFETPNPENLNVGACTFWSDPTHLQPLPPESYKVIAELRGFARVEILRLHPFPFDAHLPKRREKETRDRLNHLLFGPQDYSLLAYKG